MREIARQLNVSHSTIIEAFKRLGIQKDGLKNETRIQDRIPFGYNYKNGRLEKSEEEQEVIGTIKQLRSNGLSLRGIARELNHRLIQLCKYVYHIIVTNSKKSDAQVMRIVQGRGNQENLIKDFKDGLGLSHVPTGFFNANKVYFKIAALAWNIKTWMLNLLKIGDGSVLRFKRFLYKWIYQAGIVSTTGRNTVVIRMAEGGYFHRFQRALARVDVL